jgi:hypothetical protein
MEAAWASRRNVLAAAVGVAHGEVPRTVLGLMERVRDLGARGDCSGMDRIGVIGDDVTADRARLHRRKVGGRSRA